MNNRQLADTFTLIGNLCEIKGEVKIDKEGLKISIEEQGAAGFFASGAAEPTEEMDVTLAKLVPNLRKLTEDHELLVEGHTDNQPIHNAYFDSNWELSTARATTVVRYLQGRGVNPAVLSAEGYAEFRPVSPNDTDEGKAANRRIEIVLIPQEASK